MSIKETLLANAIKLRAFVEDTGPDNVRTAYGLCCLLGKGADFYGGVKLGFDLIAADLHRMFSEWPEFSGYLGYPVRSTYLHGDAVAAFCDAEDCMFAGEYGAARIRLLQFIIDTLTKELTQMSQSKAYKPTHGGYPGEVVVKDRPLQARLLQALDLIRDPAKWRSGKLLDKNGCMCFLGAVAKVNGIHVSVEDDEFTAVYDMLIVLPEVRALASVISGGNRVALSDIYALNDNYYGRRVPHTERHAAMLARFEGMIAKLDS